MRLKYRHTLQLALRGQHHTPATLTPVFRRGWASRPVRKGTKNLVPTGVQTPDHLKFVTINFTMTTISLQTSVAIAHCLHDRITHF